MSTNLAAMFERPADAQEAQRELLASGFDEGEVELIGSGAPKARDVDLPEYFSSLLDVDRQHEYIQCFTEGVEHGAAIVSVRDANDRLAPRAREILDRHRPVDLDTCRAQWSGSDSGSARKGTPAGASSGAGAATAGAAAAGAAASKARGAATGAKGASRSKTGGKRIPVVEEQLQVGKREVEAGGLRIVSRIRSQPVEETVRLREEHARVERHPVDRAATEEDLRAAEAGVIEIRETAEEPVVQKTARVKEELIVGTEQTERTQTVRDEVRHTEVDVQKIGGASAASNYEADFRQHAQRNFGGRNWVETEPLYQYGFSMARDPRFASHDWAASEKTLRGDWESRNGPGTWERAKEAVRYAWERARMKH